MRHPASALFLAALILSSALCGAQVPSQFKGLITTTTDHTCAGVVPCSTWPMPAIPAAGGSYVDPTWGTTTYRLAALAGANAQAVSTYSRVQPWNSNNTRMFLTEINNNDYLDLYDATTTPPTPINRITTTDGTSINAYSCDALWANTVATRIYYVPCGGGAHSRELRYVDVTNCTPSRCALTPTVVHTFSCRGDSYTPTNGGASGSRTAGNIIETGSGAQGGMFDSTDTYFSFTCDYQGEYGRAEIDFIRYNKSTDSVTTQEKWYKVCPGAVPAGCGVWNNPPSGGGHGWNMIRMNQHPSQSYISVLWQYGVNDNSQWVPGEGTEIFGPTYNYLGPASSTIAHQDMGYDVNGVPVWVGVGGHTGSIDGAWSIEVTNLTTLSTHAITSKLLYLPCQYGRVYTGSYPCVGTSLSSKTNASHISMTGTWGSVPGYALFSTMTLAGANDSSNVDMPLATTLGTAVSSPGLATVTPGTMANIAVGTQQLIDFGNANVETVMVTETTSTTFTASFAKIHSATAPVSNLTVGDTGPYAMENIAVKIDTTAANGSTAQVWRLGRAMSVRDADYNAEPHTAVNRDFTQITWGSNWNRDGGRVYGFWTKLPAAAPKASDAPPSPSAKPE